MNQSTPVLALANHKGGCGRTTTAYYLGGLLSATHKILLIDLDDQANLTNRIVRQPRRFATTIADVLLRDATLEAAIVRRLAPSVPDLIPADIRLSWAAAKIQAQSPNHRFLARALAGLVGTAEEYDLVILDCPPSADIVIVNALMACTHILICTTPTIEGYDGASRMLAMLDELRDDLQHNPRLLGMIATQVVANAKNHQRYLNLLGDSLVGTVPLRVGIDAPAQLMEAYAPIAAHILREVLGD